MRQTYRLEGVPFVLIALNTNEVDEIKVFKAHGFTDIVECEGVYKGSSERSYAVFFNGPMQLQNLFHIAKQYDQESILVVDSEREATLYYTDKERRFDLGKFKSIPKHEAVQSGCYTYVPNMDTYFKAG